MPQQSAYTSTRQIPALFKLNILEGTNFDFGGGRFDDGTEYLAEQGVTNIVYDPFCRDEEHNLRAMENLEFNGVDSISCLNVLNVIKDKEERIAVLNELEGMANRNLYRLMKFPTIFIQIYEGDRSGVPHPKNEQNNKKTKDYLPEIESVFVDCNIELIGKSKKNIFKIIRK